MSAAQQEGVRGQHKCVSGMCLCVRLLVNLQHLSAGENNLLEIPAEIGESLTHYQTSQTVHKFSMLLPWL